MYGMLPYMTVIFFIMDLSLILTPLLPQSAKFPG